MSPLIEPSVSLPQFIALIETSQGTITGLGILAIVALLVLSAFFASAEIASFSLGDHRISALIEEGTPGAATLSALKANPRRLLVTILVGNNIANIGMSAISATKSEPATAVTPNP